MQILTLSLLSYVSLSPANLSTCSHHLPNIIIFRRLRVDHCVQYFHDACLVVCKLKFHLQEHGQVLLQAVDLVSLVPPHSEVIIESLLHQIHVTTIGTDCDRGKVELSNWLGGCLQGGDDHVLLPGGVGAANHAHCNTYTHNDYPQP